MAKQVRETNEARANSIKLLDDMAADGAVSLEDVFKKLEERDGNDPLREWRESGMSDIELLVTAMKDASRSMTDSFMEFVETGRFSFRDFASSVLSDMARLTFQQTVANPLTQAFSAGIASSFGGARAAGGPVYPGKTYLVGERGKELFRPSTSGTIVPNNRLATAGDTVSVSISINTIDSASFSGRLNEHKRQITAAVDEALNKRGRRGVTQ